MSVAAGVAFVTFFPIFRSPWPADQHPFPAEHINTDLITHPRLRPEGNQHLFLSDQPDLPTPAGQSATFLRGPTLAEATGQRRRCRCQKRRRGAVRPRRGTKTREGPGHRGRTTLCVGSKRHAIWPAGGDIAAALDSDEGNVQVGALGAAKGAHGQWFPVPVISFPAAELIHAFYCDNKLSRAPPMFR